MPEHPNLTRPISIRGQHAERRREVLKAVVANPGRLGLSSLATKTGMDFRDVEDAVDGLRLKGMLRSNGKALLSPTRDGIFLITGKEEIGRVEKLHGLLLSRGAQSTGVLAKRMSLSRSRVVALLRLLADEGRARQEGDARNVRWAGIPIKSRCDPEGTARTGRQQSPAESIPDKAARPPESAPVQPSNPDASYNIDEPQQQKEAPGKGASPVAAEGTIPAAVEPGRSADTPKRLPPGTAAKALTVFLDRAQPRKWYRRAEVVALVADFGIPMGSWAYHLAIAVGHGTLERKGKTNRTRYRVGVQKVDKPAQPKRGFPRRVSQKLLDQVAELVRQRGSVGKLAEVQEATGRGRSSASSALLTLLEQGLVERRKGPRNSAVWVWIGDADTDPDAVRWARHTGKGWYWHRATNNEGTAFVCGVSLPGAPLVLLERDPDPAEALRCPHCASGTAAEDVDTDTDAYIEDADTVDLVTEETDEAPANVVAMPRQEPEDPAVQMQRDLVLGQIESMTRTKVHLTVELAKVEACLVALRGLL